MLAIRLAEQKARAVSRQHPAALVIGADQVLSVGSTRFDKPSTIEQVPEQLRLLRGTEQTLHTAVVLARDDDLVWRHLEMPILTMRHFSDLFIEQYVAAESAELLTCAGACRVEGLGQLLLESIVGQHSSILGLPVLALTAKMRQLDILLS